MPPMALTGVVTKVGYMNKTATVTIPRYVIHKITGKVHFPSTHTKMTLICFQRIERSKKILTHDEHNGPSILHCFPRLC
jgi:small subunit ribosomal protein S17